MTINQVLEFVGTQYNLSRVLGVSESAVSNWIARGGLPAKQQLLLEIMSEGALKADAKIFPKKY
jgi:DNA-binding transcriptional regulator YdaS (Cro superfamily)